VIILGWRSNDIRALIILAGLSAITVWCYIDFGYTTFTYVFGGLDVLLGVMFARVIYLREITKTYVSRFDKIDIPEDEENDCEAEEN
jgi:hypothetical protein